MNKNIKILLILLAIIILGAIAWALGKKEPAETNPPTIANPASENCVNSGGTLAIKERGDGGQYGLCYFEDNYACEEWALMNGDCPVGGRKTTGYDTEAQRYCAWLGGRTLAVDNASCSFSDGSMCGDDDLYSGKCSKGDYKVEKTLETSCSADSDCETPAEYLLMSRCPFTSKCFSGQCAVVCPKF